MLKLQRKKSKKSKPQQLKGREIAYPQNANLALLWVNCEGHWCKTRHWASGAGKFCLPVIRKPKSDSKWLWKCFVHSRIWTHNNQMCKNGFCTFGISPILLDMNAKMSHHTWTCFPLLKQFTYVDKRCLFLIAEMHISSFFYRWQFQYVSCQRRWLCRALPGSFALTSPCPSLQHLPSAAARWRCLFLDVFKLL